MPDIDKKKLNLKTLFESLQNATDKLAVTIVDFDIAAFIVDKEGVKLDDKASSSIKLLVENYSKIKRNIEYIDDVIKNNNNEIRFDRQYQPNFEALKKFFEESYFKKVKDVSSVFTVGLLDYANKLMDSGKYDEASDVIDFYRKAQVKKLDTAKSVKGAIVDYQEKELLNDAIKKLDNYNNLVKQNSNVAQEKISNIIGVRKETLISDKASIDTYTDRFFNWPGKKSREFENMWSSLYEIQDYKADPTKIDIKLIDDALKCVEEYRTRANRKSRLYMWFSKTARERKEAALDVKNLLTNMKKVRLGITTDIEKEVAGQEVIVSKNTNISNKVQAELKTLKKCHSKLSDTIGNNNSKFLDNERVKTEKEYGIFVDKRKKSKKQNKEVYKDSNLSKLFFS